MCGHRASQIQYFAHTFTGNLQRENIKCERLGWHNFNLQSLGSTNVRKLSALLIIFLLLLFFLLNAFIFSLNPEKLLPTCKSLTRSGCYRAIKLSDFSRLKLLKQCLINIYMFHTHIPGPLSDRMIVDYARQHAIICLDWWRHYSNYCIWKSMEREHIILEDLFFN